MKTLRDGFKAVLRDKLTKISEKLIKISQETTTRIFKINQMAVKGELLLMQLIRKMFDNYHWYK